MEFRFLLLLIKWIVKEKSHLNLMEELEEVLGIESYAMNWPIGMGKEFLGIYDRFNNRIEQVPY